MGTEKGNLCTELGGIAKVPLHVRDSNSLDDAATSDGSPALEGDNENSWENRLNTLKQRIEELQERFEQPYLEVGRVLIQARDVYRGHGDWIKWLKKNVPFSVRHAQRLIRVAEIFDDATLVSRMGLTSSKAYVLTRIGKKDTDHFCNSFFSVGNQRKLVKNMTKRELELVVSSFLKGKLSSRDHEEAISNQGIHSNRPANLQVQRSY